MNNSNQKLEEKQVSTNGGSFNRRWSQRIWYILCSTAEARKADSKLKTDKKVNYIFLVRWVGESTAAERHRQAHFLK